MSLLPLAIGASIAAVVILFMRADRADPKAVVAAVQAGAPLLDVRSADEYDAGHLPGAQNVALPQLNAWAATADRQAPVAVYCRSGTRSAVAARRLRKLGFVHVLDLGGASRWPQSRSAPQA